jgi:hypothetical protein
VACQVHSRQTACHGAVGMVAQARLLGGGAVSVCARALGGTLLVAAAAAGVVRSVLPGGCRCISCNMVSHCNIRTYSLANLCAHDTQSCSSDREQKHSNTSTLGNIY